jgi:GNAT superfamily N-acetyltransferase
MGSVRISSDPRLLDMDLVYRFISEESYWAKKMPRKVFEKGIAHSVCFGAYDDETGKQIGFARVITDRATFGWLSDVFVLPEHRGRGVSKALLKAVMEHPELQGFRRMLLGTRDGHGLYAKFGFKPVAKPEFYMEIWDPEIYQRGT